MESAEEVLGFRKGKSKPWISQQTWRVIDRLEEGTHDQVRQHQVREDTKQDQGGVQAEG